MVNVSIIRAFEGPRHSKLELIWDVIAEYYEDDLSLNIFVNPNARLSHAACLNEMWKQELDRTASSAILTEFDFLPDLHTTVWLYPDHDCEVGLSSEYPIIAPQYVIRHPDTGMLGAVSRTPGAWYLYIDKTVIGHLDFSPSGSHNDPANGLLDYLGVHYPQCGIAFMYQYDAMPSHYGTKMLTGEHLFWSRHLHDDPDMTISGVNLGRMQELHDRAIETWIRKSPPRFQRIYASRRTPTRPRSRVPIKTHLVPAKKVGPPSTPTDCTLPSQFGGGEGGGLVTEPYPF